MVTKNPRIPTHVLIKLNDLGLGLKKIASIVGYHWTTVSDRLEESGNLPCDTRSSFMERVYDRLTENQRNWLADDLKLGQPIDAYIKDLIVEKYNKRKI